MYNGLLHAHSGFRWIALIMVIVLVVNSIMGYKSGKKFGQLDHKLAIFGMSAMHLQAVFGFVLFFLSPKVQFSGASMSDSFLRFFLVEHPMLMLLAVVLATVGHVKAKKETEDSKKFKKLALFYGVALLLIILGVVQVTQNGGGMA